MSKVVVLGSGGWGIALAIKAYNNGHNVSLWTPFQEEANTLASKRESEKLLKGIKIPDDINISTDINVANGVDAIIIATPSFAVRETAKRLSTLSDVKLVVNVAKGLDKENQDRLSVVIREYLPKTNIVILSGPSHAEEVAIGIPTSLVAASESLDSAVLVQELLSGNTLRIYTGDDVVGAEFGGAFKNIIAVAAGICDGMKLGDNTKAAMMTRGLSEVARLGVKLGAREETFAGLTGVGDLIVTCTSKHSRNYRFGYLVGSGKDVNEALAEVGTVEGYHAAKLAFNLSKKEDVELPIIESVYLTLYEGFSVAEMIKKLMTRPSKAEYEKSWLTNKQ